MELDREKIKQKFSEIHELMKEVKRLASLDEKEFWSKKENLAALKYYLLIAIEAVGSVCVHIAAKKFNKGVSVFGECFEILGREGALEENLVSRLRQMVKFRNMLIHRYGEIDDKRVLEYSRKDMVDFDDFIKSIGKMF